MNKKIMEFMQIALVILATLTLIVMNVFAFSPVTLNMLRVLLALCWITAMIMSRITHKMTIREEEP